MILCGTPTGWLDVDSYPLHTAAWTMPDLVDLWMGGDVRGDDRLLPGLPGVLPYIKRATTTKHSLPMTICGDVDPAGVRYDNPWEGLELNIDLLRANVVDPTYELARAGQRAFTLHMPSGATRQAYCHVLRLERGVVGEGTTREGVTGVLMRATLEISIPKPGVFV